MRAERIATLLESVDSVLLPQGFRRGARAQEWHRMAGPSDEAWVHVNIGKGVVNPSVGVRYLDLAGLLPEAVGSVDRTMQMLGGLFRPVHTYSLDAGPETLLDDLRERGVAALARLLDRHAVIDMLKSPAPSDWPVPGLSWRIRLLPLLLATQGRVEEALHVADGFRADAAGRDQILPGYAAFLDAFRTRFAIQP